ncbi:uncharacterized protein LOC134505922 [Candoia aspera]|uniref:uncharacterized protein LOC134505922 n=1 Tax=Candoia aspera TaxID=51853 RepID=UPI002FD7DF6B
MFTLEMASLEEDQSPGDVVPEKLAKQSDGHQRSLVSFLDLERSSVQSLRLLYTACKGVLRPPRGGSEDGDWTAAREKRTRRAASGRAVRGAGRGRPASQPAIPRGHGLRRSCRRPLRQEGAPGGARMGQIRARPRRPACWALLTAAALCCCCCCWGAEGQVYYSCGAQFNSLERGLILSPGFPNNYSSGMHCVWRFLIPAKTYLLLEIFDFDVFESISENPNAWDGYFSFTKSTNTDSSPSEETTEFSSTIFPAKTSVPHDLDSKDLDDGFPEATSQNLEWKEFHPREPQELAVTQPSKFPVQGVTNDTLTRQMSDGKRENKDLVDKIFFAHYPAKENAKVPPNHLGKVIFGEDVAISTMILPINISSTPPFSADVCPDDVLYVSDLTAFSSRFCGTKSPLNKNMTFGSSLKMVEVIVELITTTDRGRGFAMLFEYKNSTEMISTNDVKDGEENMMMMVVITGILFFSLILLSSLCIACR